MRILRILAILLIITTFPTDVFAQQLGNSVKVITNITLSPGSATIEMTGPVNFSDITLNGNQMVARGTMPNITIIDARGSVNGWHITVLASEFVSGEHRIPASSITFDSVTGASVTATDGSDPPPTVVMVPQNLSIEQRFIYAAQNYGKGTFLYSSSNPGLTVIVPPNAFSGSYSGSLIVTLYDLPM